MFEKAPRPSGDVTGFKVLAAGDPIDVAVAMQPLLFRDVLSRALARLPGLRVTPDSCGEDQVDRVLKYKPRVLLVDDQGLARGPDRILRHLRRVAPATRMLVMSTQPDEKACQEMMSAGAFGVVEKRCDLETLARAIRAVAAGGLWTGRRTAGTTPKRLTVLEGRRASEVLRLTSREAEIAESIGRGRRNQEIALRLGISPETVKTHLNHIFRKLRLHGRIALGIWAREHLSRSS